MDLISYDDLLGSLSDLSMVKQNAGNLDEFIELRRQINLIVEDLSNLDDITQDNLCTLIQNEPDAVPLLASCVGLGREKLRGQLQHRLGTSGWVMISRKEPHRVISMLEQFNLIERLKNSFVRNGHSMMFCWNVIFGQVDLLPVLRDKDVI